MNMHTDYDAVLSALDLLGLLDTKVRWESSPELGLAEIWLAADNALDDEGGFKFTFKNGNLIGIHIRALPEHDITKDVVERANPKPNNSTVKQHAG